jgi:phosphoglycerate dehydrogenase-like enzyme
VAGAGGVRHLAGPSERPHSEAVTRVAILDDYQGVALRLADWGSLPAGVDVVVFRDHAVDEAVVAARLADFDVVVAMRERTPFPRSLLNRLRRLRLLVTTGMRNASIDLRAAADHGVVVCGTAGLPYPTAELTWALILALVRHVPQEDRATRDGRWQETLGIGLNGKTLGVLGLGQLGSRVARVGRAFEMEVLAWSQNLTPERAVAAGAILAGTRDELLTRADVVTIHLVLSDRTRGLVGARELALMRRSAYLVNTSRGAIVDERALVDALRAGAIAGAGLDVYEEEPLPPDHPLRGLPNTVITPHLGYVTEETYRLFYAQALEDVGAFLAGTPVRVLSA